MLATLQDLGGGTGGFDELIDVRSPGEFAEDHMPDAVNLPVLDDAERAEVGTIYVQRSKFEARRVGAAYIARNVAAHLQDTLRDRPGGWAPLLYCWRGGQRSQAMGLILSQVGWRTTVLQGGYRTYRRGVVASLYDSAPSLRVVLLDGPTGVGKTAVLERLAARGVQTLDLEALANHRGSVFGDMGPQPSQKLFESRLAARMAALNPARMVVMEAESSRIGDRFLPPTLWSAMQAAPRIELAAPVEARAAGLAQTYAALAADPAHLIFLLERLPGRHGRERLGAWSRLAAAGEVEALAADLIAEHYDPAYTRTRRDTAREPLALIGMADAGAVEVERVAKGVEALLSDAVPEPEGLRSRPIRAGPPESGPSR